MSYLSNRILGETNWEWDFEYHLGSGMGMGDLPVSGLGREWGMSKYYGTGSGEG